MKKQEIKVFVKEPGKAPALRSVPNELAALQTIVGGYIETVTVASDLVIICNEEGRRYGLPYNCDVCGVSFCGTIIFAGIDGEEFADAPEKFIRDYIDVYDGRPEADRLRVIPGDRTVEVTWWKPEEKLPEDDVLVLGVVSGANKNISLFEAMELLSYTGDDGWLLDQYPELRDVEVLWWCELPCVPDEEDAG